MKICQKCGTGKEFYSTSAKWCKECVKEWARSNRAKKSSVWKIERVCKLCGVKFIPKLKQQTICDYRQCPKFKEHKRKLNKVVRKKYIQKNPSRYKAMRVKRYHERNKEEPVRMKAQRLSAKLGWGIGATDKLEKMIEEVLGKPCYWCKSILTIETASIDHKNPIHHNSRHKYYPQELKELNDPSNIRVICKPCNQMKSSIPEDKFQKLWDFLNTDYKLKEMVVNKLKTSNLMWFRNHR